MLTIRAGLTAKGVVAERRAASEKDPASVT